MLRNSLKAGKPFKSPLDPSKAKSNPNDQSYEKLLEREKELDEQIKALEGDDVSEDELKEYIDLLHKYNERKDLAQSLMGQIAVLEGVSLKTIAARFDAPTETDN